jgi:hypothetical protein
MGDNEKKDKENKKKKKEKKELNGTTKFIYIPLFFNFFFPIVVTGI